MSTKALINVYDEDDEKLCTIYKHFDGYIDGLGKFLYNFLNDKTIIDGFGNPEEASKVSFNGMGDLAARLIHALKDYQQHSAGYDIGNVYIVSVGTSNVNEEYVYDIYYVEEGEPAQCLVTELNGRNGANTRKLESFFTENEETEQKEVFDFEIDR